MLYGGDRMRNGRGGEWFGSVEGGGKEVRGEKGGRGDNYSKVTSSHKHAIHDLPFSPTMCI